MNPVILEYQSVTSTSELAQELLHSESLRPPFAVIAETQTSGKGRQGHKWQSPPGNIYVTFAFDPSDLGEFRIPIIPLRCAVVVAEWLESKFHISPLLKWPNDVLVGGRKLAGILCETSIQGYQQGPLLIGIGCNLNVVPVFPGNYFGTSIAELSGESFDAKICAKDFCDFFIERFFNYRDLEIIDGYCARGYHKGERLYRGNEAFGFDCYDMGGLLHLRSMLGNKSEQLSSTDASLIWHGHGDRPILVADIGNTATKIAKFAQGDQVEYVWHFRNTESYLVKIPDWLSEIPADVPIFAASVNDKQLQTLNKILSVRSIVEVAKRRIFTWGSHYNFSPLGLDRLANMEAAVAHMRQSGNHRPILVVSVGTAVTVDLLSHLGEHLGGWICAGPQTAVSSLGEKTAALPALNLHGLQSKVDWGSDPSSAILFGAGAQVRGLLLYAKEFATTTLATKIADQDVYVTGGFAAMIKSEGVSADPNLTLKGIKLLALRGLIFSERKH